jgi:cyclopropane fatty-acyl-phospholipid synthase-like methyltransferase
MRKLFLALLATKIVARNMLAPGGGLLGAIASRMMTRGNRLQSEDAAERLDVDPDHSVLELGPGSGWGMRVLAEGNPKRLVGVEISARFRDELAGMGLSVDHEVHGDDALDMSRFLDDGSVDRMLAVNVAYFLDPLADYAGELFRVMAPGSRGLLACKAAIKDAHDDVFVNKDLQAIADTFAQAGFRVSREEIDLGDPVASYTAIHLAK